MAIEEREDVFEEENGAENNGGTDGGADGAGAANESAGGSKGAAEKTFTQQQVNRMMAREKNQGRAAAFRDLGIDPKDKNTISLLQSIFSKASVSSAGAEDAANADEKSELESRAQLAEAKVEALKMGAQPAFVDDVVALAMSKMKEGSDLATVIGEIKSKYSIMFEPKADDDKAKGETGAAGKVGQKGTGSSIKGGSGAGAKDNEQGNLGARLAAQRKSRSAKKSFWS